jgi:hypothetical protein
LLAVWAGTYRGSIGEHTAQGGGSDSILKYFQAFSAKKADFTSRPAVLLFTSRSADFEDTGSASVSSRATSLGYVVKHQLPPPK